MCCDLADQSDEMECLLGLRWTISSTVIDFALWFVFGTYCIFFVFHVAAFLFSPFRFHTRPRKVKNNNNTVAPALSQLLTHISKHGIFLLFNKVGPRVNQSEAIAGLTNAL